MKVFQRLKDRSVDFNRNWTEYQGGFGNLSRDFWLGERFTFFFESLYLTFFLINVIIL